MNSGAPHVIFAGGGTGGHLFPGLAVAETLRNLLPTLTITFCGTPQRFGQEHAERAGFRYLALPACPIPRSVSSAARFLRDQPRAMWAARQYLALQPTAAVVGLGGYASVPAVRAAWRRRVPVVLLEQNVVPGRATRLLARRGTVVCGAFAESRSFFSPAVRFHLTGNPVRDEVAGLARRADAASPPGGPHWSRGSEKASTSRSLTPHSPLAHSPTRSLAHPPTRTLLVLGGSQGARSLNRAVPRALASLEATARNWHVIHQSGPAERREVAGLYEQTALSFEVAAFFEGMADVYRRADLVICRAGGTTLAELACAGLAAVLIPYPHAAGDHQRLNAQWYASRNAARIVADDAEPHRLAQSLKQTLAEILADDSLRCRMSESMKALAQPRASQAVAQMLKEIVES